MITQISIKPFDISLIDFNQLAQARYRRLEIGHLLRNQLKMKGGLVLGQHHAIAIVYQPTRWRQRHQAYTIIFGQVGKMCVFNDLQIPEADHQRNQQEQANNRSKNHTAAK